MQQLRHFARPCQMCYVAPKPHLVLPTPQRFIFGRFKQSNNKREKGEKDLYRKLEQNEVSNCVQKYSASTRTLPKMKSKELI